MLRNNKFSKQIVILVSTFLLAVNGTLGFLLVRQSKNALKFHMRERMLDISKSAAALLDGDILEKLQKEDEETEPYQKELAILRAFQEQVELKYIYGIRDMGNKTFTFTIDPTVEDPGIFGEPIMYTDALYEASLGTPSVDEEAYEDKWGRFYSAYSPVFNSAGKVAGIVAVDIDATWYEKQLRRHVYTILIACAVSLLLGGVIVFLIMGRLRKRFHFLSSEMTNLAAEVEELAAEMQLATEIVQDKDNTPKSQDDFDELGNKLKSVREELQQYILDAQSMAYLDSLTGLGNRNAYIEVLKRLDGQIADGIADFSVAVFDINGLKEANDKFGHEFGDLMIKTIAEIIKACVNTDLLYRIGGDEFVAILENDDEKAFEKVFEAINQKLAERGNVLSYGEDSMPLAVSKGAASFIKGDDTEVKSVFRRADDAMYADKADWYKNNWDRRRR